MRNRWCIALAAVGIHISIGSVYAWSVLTRPIMAQLGFSLAETTWAFSLAILFLGFSAGFLGKYVEKYGPKRSGLVSMCFFGAGMLGTALALSLGSLPLLYLFYGVGLREALHTRPDLGSVECYIAYLVPCPLAVGVEGERRMCQRCPADTLALGLVGNRLLHTECIQLAGRSQQTRLRQCEREDGIATQRLTGLCAVHQDSLHAEERSEGESLGLLIRIYQRREDVLRLLLYARW